MKRIINLFERQTLSQFKIQAYFIALLILFIICYGSRVSKADNGCDLHQKKRTTYKKYVRKNYKHLKAVSFYGKRVLDGNVSPVTSHIAIAEVLNPKFR